jgi:hypothetical protein
VVVSGIDAAYDMCHGGERILFFARIVNIFFVLFSKKSFVINAKKHLTRL